MSQKSQIEKTLADMAISRVQERVPSLMNYYFGFEMINSNDDGSRAAGILGFRIGKELIYVPVLFLNGQLKGDEIMYLKNSDVFTSLSKQWVEFLTTQGQGGLGEAAPLPPHLHDQGSNAFRLLYAPPQAQKNGADKMSQFINMSKVAANGESKTGLLHKFISGMSKKAYSQFINFICKEQPELLSIISRVHDPETLKVKLASDPTEAPNSTLGGNPDSDRKEEKIEFVTIEKIEKDPAKYDDATKEKVVRESVAIVDRRAEEETSALVPATSVRERFSNPTKSGFYEMLNRFGSISKVMIIVAPEKIGAGFRSKGVCIIDPETGAYCHRDRADEVFVRSELNHENWLDVFKKGLEVEDAVVGKKYVMINERLDGTIPFRIQNRISGDDATDLIASISWGFDGEKKIKPAEPHVLMPQPGDKLNDCSCSDDVRIRPVEIENGALRSFHGTVFVPENWRLVEINFKSSSSSYKEEEANRAKITPGNPGSLYAALSQNGLKELKVTKTAFHYFISVDDKTSPEMNKDWTLYTLVGRMGLKEADARKLIDDAKSMPDLYLFKSAAAQLESEMAFPSVEDMAGAVPYSNVPEQTGVQIQEAIPENLIQWPNVVDPQYGTYEGVNKNNLELLSRAADTGRADVFDPAMIGLLLRSSRVQTKVEDMIPDLVDGLDKKCRLLLLFYWHNNDFISNYGSDEMAEFEDVLLNCIKNEGMLVLFLKQRSSESPSTKLDAFASKD